jgi:hypothetical protein
VAFTKPIEHELVVELNLTEMSPKDDEHLELLWMVAKEGWQKAALSEYHTQRQALSRYSIGAVLMSDTVVDVVRRELRRISPGVKIEQEEIRNVIFNEVIKREVVEGDKATEAKRQMTRAANRTLRARTPKDGTPIVVSDAPVASSERAIPTVEGD